MLIRGLKITARPPHQATFVPCGTCPTYVKNLETQIRFPPSVVVDSKRNTAEEPTWISLFGKLVWTGRWSIQFQLGLQACRRDTILSSVRTPRHYPNIKTYDSELRVAAKTPGWEGRPAACCSVASRLSSGEQVMAEPLRGRKSQKVPLIRGHRPINILSSRNNRLDRASRP